MAKPRFNPNSHNHSQNCDAKQRNLAVETLCHAFPTGAVVLDAQCSPLFFNREALDLLARWNAKSSDELALKARPHPSMPSEIIKACLKLRHGGIETGQRILRPKFGGRILVRHPTKPNLSAVVALERSTRDRRVAVFCVLLQDGLKIGVGAGRGDHLAMLTIAERRVAKLVADGLRNGDIAAVLGKSVATVKSQLMTVFAKLNISSRTQLVTLLRSNALS
jgi:DNA-binding CsgD family transcriptional regulator